MNDISNHGNVKKYSFIVGHRYGGSVISQVSEWVEKRRSLCFAEIVSVHSLHPMHAAQLGDFDLVDPKLIPVNVTKCEFSNVNEVTVPAYFETARPDLIFVMGLRQILAPDFLQRLAALRITVLGFHPAPLPQFPGASPIQHAVSFNVLDWAVSCFEIKDGPVDAGPLISVDRFDLPKSVDATYLDAMVSTTIASRVATIMENSGHYVHLKGQRPRGQLLPQLPRTNAWLDPNQKTEELAKKIKMYAKPYLGAYLTLNGSAKRVYGMECTSADVTGDIGKVLSMDDSSVDLHCLEGVIRFYLKC